MARELWHNTTIAVMRRSFVVDGGGVFLVVARRYCETLSAHMWTMFGVGNYGTRVFCCRKMRRCGVIEQNPHAQTELCTHKHFLSEAHMCCTLLLYYSCFHITGDSMVKTKWTVTCGIWCGWGIYGQFIWNGPLINYKTLSKYSEFWFTKKIIYLIISIRNNMKLQIREMANNQRL